MTVQANNIIEDLQQCIFSLVKDFTDGTAPWTSWTPVLGYPETETFEQFTKPLIYIMAPVLTDTQWQQGGLYIGAYEGVIGAWDDRKTGGTEEINIISSRILWLFGNPNTAHATTFDVVTDATYTNTTLIAQGLRVEGIAGPREIATEEIKELRVEFTLSIIA